MRYLYVVDDDDIWRDWVSEATDFLPDIGVRGFESGEELLAELPTLAPGVTLIDLRMPGMSGLETLEAYRDVVTRFPTIVMSGAGDIESAVRAIRLGALDFLIKPCTQRILFEKIGAGFEALDRYMSSVEARSDQASRFAKLSEREREILRLLIEGRANRHIAEQLDLSVRTVEAYRGKAMAKLGVTSLPEAIRLAYEAGFVEPVS